MTARWPALMLKRTAAEYCDMAEAAFLREIAAGRFPAGVMVGGRERWRKDALDAAIARLGGSNPQDEDMRRLEELCSGKKAA